MRSGCSPIFLLVVACLSVVAAAFAEPTDPPGRPLRIAAEDYPPYEYLDEGVPKGIDVEVFETVFDRLGIEYEIEFYPFTRGWLMLTKGKVDAAPSISYQPFREPHLYYTDGQREFAKTGRVPEDYLWMTEYVFFVNRKFRGSLRFESYDQIKKDGYTIGLLKEYSYHPGFLEQGFETRMYVDPMDGMQALARGEIDLFPMDKTVGLSLLTSSGLGDRIAYLQKTIFTKPYLMTFSRASDYPDVENVMSDFYRELHKMRENGEYDAIVRKYARATPRKFLFVCEDWPPFECIRDGKAHGINVDILDRIMKTLNVPYEIRIYPWSRAWMMAERGSADAVLSVSYKASRESVLHYTDGQRAFAETGAIPPDYLWISEYVFFVLEGNGGKFRFESYEQLRADKPRIGTNRDYSYDSAFLEAGLSSREFNDTKEGLDALVTGEIDLYPMDKTVGIATLREMGLRESVTFLPKPLFSKPYLAPFVRKSDYPGIEWLMRDFNRALRSLRDSGDYDAIVQKHLGDHYIDP